MTGDVCRTENVLSACLCKVQVYCMLKKSIADHSNHTCKECTLYCVYKVDAVAGLKVKVTSYRFCSQQPKTFSLVKHKRNIDLRPNEA